MIVLGIESSCDDTGVAVYDSDHGLLSHCLFSQESLHAEYGGVVPELASRDHVRKILPLIREALKKGGICRSQLQGIAYTKGPGLVGSLLVGAVCAKSLAWALGIPSLGVHHMEAHLLAAMLEQNPPPFPFIALLVSGGHTSLVHVKKLGQYQILGETLDDAVGEAFDKTAKLLGLPYPGGAALSQLAEEGLPGRFTFPRPMLDRPGLDFSYSGLKTSAASKISNCILTQQERADIAYAFQEAIIDTLIKKSFRALKLTGEKNLVVAGGVGANKSLRQRINSLGLEQNYKIYYPSPQFCTDNGAMVAYSGCQRLLLGEKDENLEIEVKPRWSLESLV